MNRKQFIILLILVVVLGAAGLLHYQRNASSWSSGGQSIGRKLLGDLPTNWVNDVAAIAIKAGTNELTLAKNDNLWRVQQRNDYPADFSLISGFLLKAAELKVTQTEEVGPSQLGRYNLLPPGPGTNTGALVEFKAEGGKTLQSLLIGKPHTRKPARPSPGGEFGDEGYADGRYVMVGVGAKTMAVISDPLSNAEAKPEQWLNKGFFKVEKIRSIAVAFPVATNSWQASRLTETNTDWKLAPWEKSAPDSSTGTGNSPTGLADAKPDEPLDSSKASGFSYALSSPTFVDVLSADTKEPTGLDKPTVVSLDTFDHFTYTVRVGSKTNDNCYLTVSVAADLPKERVPGKDEKPEDKDKLDKEFKDQQSKLAEKLKQEQSYGKWVYLVSNWTVESLLKERSQLLVEKKEESKPDEIKPDEPKKDAATNAASATEPKKEDK